MMKLTCKYLETCQGCPMGGLEIQHQRELKKNKLVESIRSTLPAPMIQNVEYDYVFPAFDRYRTRCDFIYENGRLGWMGKDRNFLPIDECPLHNLKLSELAVLISKLPWPVRRGSMRLRVSPDGQCGVWLDLANLDIKEILSNSSTLESLFAAGVIVEMGQKGKRVIRSGEGFKLSDPTPYPWFQTQLNGATHALNTLISSFTQTSPELNIKMIEILRSFLDNHTFSNIIEFGCGVGNFTLFLSEYTESLNVIENDPRNLIPLRQNIQNAGLASRVTIFESLNSFHRNQPESSVTSLYFVNPARSGVGALFDQSIAAKQIVYVSCHLESFLKDVVKLEGQGFELVKATLFDQFPHANHFEILSYFQKKN